MTFSQESLIKKQMQAKTRNLMRKQKISKGKFHRKNGAAKAI
jgi:hypothetical protein